jgi:glutathione synthase/RimK-type ligase-like ATP-grasp enzyme
VADTRQPDVVLVTGRQMRRPDPEIHLLVAALEQQSIDVVIRPWDDATAWASVPLVVVRSPWDYTDAHEEFLSWARSVAAVTRLVNPLEVLEWNSHKSYLLALASAGVSTVVTTLVRRGASDVDQAHALAAYPGEIVIKPAISVGAIGALRTASDSPEAASHLADLSSSGDVLVQPLARAVLDGGESSLIYFGGLFSHAIRKLPAAGDYRVQEHHGGRVVAHDPTDDEFAVAAATLTAAPAATAYARVDLVQVAGSAAVMELEAIEPQLFLDRDAHAAARFATHIATLLP